MDNRNILHRLVFEYCWGGILVSRMDAAETRNSVWEMRLAGEWVDVQLSAYLSAMEFVGDVAWIIICVICSTAAAKYLDEHNLARNLKYKFADIYHSGSDRVVPGYEKRSISTKAAGTPIANDRSTNVTKYHHFEG